MTNTKYPETKNNKYFFLEFVNHVSKSHYREAEACIFAKSGYSKYLSDWQETTADCRTIQELEECAGWVKRKLKRHPDQVMLCAEIDQCVKAGRRLFEDEEARYLATREN